LDTARDLSDLQNREFDVVIVGGGVSGAWLSLHCAQQGLTTALIEKNDYASQTSAASSKTLHGGIRYLQQMQFGKVRESAMERAEFIYAAPHLSRPIPFIIPTYSAFQKSKLFLNCGMLAYRALCIGENNIIGSAEQNLPPVKSISANKLNHLCDLSNENHTGGVVFYERHMYDSERMVLAIIKTAQQASAITHNYVSAQHFVMSNNRVVGVQAKDELTGTTMEIPAKVVINAAGPWIDTLNSKLINAEQAPNINGFAIGSHIISRRQISDHAIAVTTKQKSDTKLDRGGRHMFIIPWRGCSIIGTSYNASDEPNQEIRLQPNHVDQLLDGINSGLPSAKLTREDLISGFSGLYDLRTDKFETGFYQGSGEYQVIDHAKTNGVEGVITALGAKYTTARKLSELTIKQVNHKLGSTGTPARSKLINSNYDTLSTFTKTKIEQYKAMFSAATVRHLIAQYGSQLDQFIERISDQTALLKPICAHQEDISDFAGATWH